jgi:hypothetical protein
LSQNTSVFSKTRRFGFEKSIGQDKYVGAQMNLYNPILEELFMLFKTIRL